MSMITKRRNDHVTVPCSGIAGQDMIQHIYVHIPFCARICPYCAFYKDLVDRSQTGRFCEAIVQELKHAVGMDLRSVPNLTGNGDGPSRTGVSEMRPYRYDVRPTTIYFGGGTPTALTTSQLEFVLGGFRESLDLSDLVEWTMEANPGSVSERKAAILRKFGVNRISLGVQSWDDDLLKILGREHNAAQAQESVEIL